MESRLRFNTLVVVKETREEAVTQKNPKTPADSRRYVMDGQIEQDLSTPISALRFEVDQSRLQSLLLTSSKQSFPK